VHAIFSPGTIPIAYLETALPIIFWTDATFSSMVGYYPGWSDLCNASIREGNWMEQAAISRASAAVYSSSWAANSAVNDYAADPMKVKVLAFGANLANEPNELHVAESIEKRPRHQCRLLFLGVDWRRKGGDRALEIAVRLTEMGLPTRLAVVGPPAREVPDSELIDYFGFIDKSTTSGEAAIVRLLSQSHFLCLPSHAECSPIVFCEASACGVPSIATRTGGIESVVTSGTNGYIFDEPFSIQLAAHAIAACMAEYDDLYVPLAVASRREYRSRLNWAMSAKSLLQILSGEVRR
jgi:glycosyltransferase involved in cell wall biosynthesis